MDNQRFEDIIREIQESRKRAQEAEQLMQRYAEKAAEPTREVELAAEYVEPELPDAEVYYADAAEPATDEPYYEHPAEDGTVTFEEYCEQNGYYAEAMAAGDYAEEPEEEYEGEEYVQQEAIYDENGYAVNEDTAAYDYSAEYDAEGYPVEAAAEEYGYAAEYDAEGYPIENGAAAPAEYAAQYDENGYAVDYAEEIPAEEYAEAPAELVPFEGELLPAEYAEQAPAEEYPVEYDANGYQIFYDEAGNPLENDIYGYPIQYDANGFLIHYDAEGYPLENDEAGNPILYNEGDVYYGVGPAAEGVALYGAAGELQPYEDSFETEGLELSEDSYAEPDFYEEPAPAKKRGLAAFFAKKSNIIIAAVAAVAVIGGIVAAILLFGGKDDVVVVEPEVNGESTTQPLPEQPDTVVLPGGGDAGQLYVDNTLFIGDSNTVRMSFLGIVPEDNTAAIVGAGIGDIGTMTGVYFEELSSPVTILEAVEMMQPGRIIMNFGTNDQKLTSADFIASYKKAIEDIKAVCPDADIIVSAIFPATNANQYSLSLTLIEEFNKTLLEMCEELEIPFLNVTEVMENLSSGEIKADYVVSDGVHLTASGLKAYVTYARTHALTGGTERPANSGDYTRKETPYVPLDDDKEDPIDQSEMLRQLGLFMTKQGYKQAASDAKLTDTTKWTLTKVEYKVTKEQNREGNEDVIAETVFQKVKDQNVATEAVFRLECAAGSEEGTLNVIVYLAKVVEHKCDDEANFEEDTTKAVKATCTTDGKKVGKCKLCGKEVTIAVKSEGHKYDEANLVVNFKPSCTVEGKGTNTCTVTGCGFVNDKVVIPATGHDFEHADCEIVAETPAKCGVKGAKSIKCHNDGCLVTKEVEIPALEHNYTGAETIITDSTCTTVGKKTVACANTGCTSTTEKEIPVKEHNYATAGEVTQAATCGAPGKQKYSCSCGATTEKEIAATGAHTYTDGVCTGCGAAEPTP